MHFTNQITLKQSLSQKLNLFSNLAQLRDRCIFQLEAHGHKGWSKDEKTFKRCYTIALKFWDEFNANFVLLNFSSYRSTNIWHLYLKNVEKKQ